MHDLDKPLPHSIAKNQVRSELLCLTSQYDLVTCFAVSEMLSDVNVLLREISKVMKNNGEAWISVQWDKDGSNPLSHQAMKQYTPEQVKETWSILTE